MEKENRSVLSTAHYLVLLAGLVVLGLGFSLMCLDTAPYGFGTLGLTIGPLLVLLGLALPFFSIFTLKAIAGKDKSRTKFDLLNRLTGWLIFSIALTVYVLTLEPTTSFWDCGEFIASAYKLQVPHPPGAPLFLLIGRLFSLLSFGDVTKVAFWVNMVSALASAFTILFLFWTITSLAYKILVKFSAIPDKYQTVLILASGAIGAFSFTFSDSFWFSAVEAEVYALSSFFTALVFWAMLRWESTTDPVKGYRWLILIAYLLGLSIGVHLLNLLAIPAMAFIYYHRYYAFRYKGALLTLIISLLLIAVIMWGIIPGLPALAGNFEIFFINQIGLPFGAGLIIFLVLFTGSLIYGLQVATRRGNFRWQTLLLSFIYILIGYSTYLIVPIRSGYNPLIDENNPEDILSFVSYLRREQYEQRPLLYGPQFSTDLIDQQQGAAKYARGKNNYEIVDNTIEPVYDPKALQVLPRLYHQAPEQIAEYKKWVNIKEGEKTTLGQNLAFLLRYQLGHMYGRYFLWNFVGRDSDVQHAGVNWPWEKSTDLPYELARNKARNNYFLLPLLFGLAGCIFHFRRNKSSAQVILILFLFTGLAIAFYLNQPPLEPRERDYAFVGSFYAFAIWIGLGVPALFQLIRRFSLNQKLTIAITLLFSLAVPVIMAMQGWDDHNRSGRYYATDFARNMLESCAPNAILFTNGDNDTFPLWYAQEVEGIRRDVRVIVLTYLNTDWYIDQMKRRAYESAPLPISLARKDYRFSQNNYLPLVERPQVAAGMDLQTFLSLVKQNHPVLQVQAQDGRTFLSLPTQNFYLDVDTAAVLKQGIIPPARTRQVVSRMHWHLSGKGLEKKQLVIADILASNHWERPIYFSTTTNTEDFMYLRPYLQLEGLAYRVLPVQNPNSEADAYIAKDLMYQNLRQKFKFRNLQNPDIYYDYTYRSQITANMRRRLASLAEAYLAAGDIPKAREILNYTLKVMPDTALPYDFYSPLYVELLYQAGEKEKANRLFSTLTRRTQQALQYYTNLPNSALFERELQLNLIALQQLALTARHLNKPEASALEAAFMKYYNLL